MPPKLLFDISEIDFSLVEYDREQIRERNPQRHEFEQLSGVVWVRPEERIAIAIKDVSEDEFWVKGHMPGRPLLPGVLMLEAAAQLSAFYNTVVNDSLPGFLGFGGVDHARFRGTVVPGQRLIILGKSKISTPKRSVFETQGVVDGKVVFQATILGIRIPPTPEA